MANQVVQDDVVSIAEVDDPAARWDFALRSHPQYTDAPQVHIQATVQFRGANPMMATFCAGLFSVFFAHLGPGESFTIACASFVLGLMGWFGVIVGLGVVSFTLQSFGAAAFVPWMVAAVAVILLSRGRSMTLTIPPEIGLGEWEEFKDGVRGFFGGERRILRGKHFIAYMGIAILAAGPFVFLSLLMTLLVPWGAVGVALAFSLVLPRLATGAASRDADVILVCSAVGISPEAEVRDLAWRLNLTSVIVAAAALASFYLPRIPGVS